MLIYSDSPQFEKQCKPFNLKCFYVICSNRKEGSQTKRFLRQPIGNIEWSENRWRFLIQSTENITVPHSVNSLWVINWTLRNWANCRIWDGLFNAQKLNLESVGYQKKIHHIAMPKPTSRKKIQPIVSAVSWAAFSSSEYIRSFSPSIVSHFLQRDTVFSTEINWLLIWSCLGTCVVPS